MTDDYIPYKNYERIDLTQYMCNQGKMPEMLMPDIHSNKIKPKERDQWWYGEQMDAIRFYTSPDHIVPILTVQDNDYDGELYSILHFDNGLGDDYNITRFVLLKDSFGSGSGEDLIMWCKGNEGYDYVHDILMENSVQFLNLNDIIAYLNGSNGLAFCCYSEEKRDEIVKTLEEYIERQKILNERASKGLKVEEHHITGYCDVTSMHLDAKYYEKV